MRAERPIIVPPKRQSWRDGLGTRTIGSLAWGIWLVLWMPVLSSVLWVFGTRTTYIYIVRAPDETSLLLIFVVMFICNFVVSSWSGYNYIRFSKNKKRRGCEPIPYEKVGALFGITDPKTLSMLLNSRVLGLQFNESGALIQVDNVEVDSIPIFRETLNLTPSIKVVPALIVANQLSQPTT
jgi:poly-beta-1,6-N-acetyl-D-glucosamine biosynthesis protein PgaD